MRAIEVRRSVRLTTVGLIAAHEVELQRIDAAGSTGVVECFRERVAGKKSQTKAGALRDAGLECVVACVERRLAEVRSAGEPLERNSLGEILVRRGGLTIDRIFRRRDQSLIELTATVEMPRCRTDVADLPHKIFRKFVLQI